MALHTPSPGNGRGRSTVSPGQVSHSFSFTKGDPQPQLRSYQFAANGTEIELSLQGEEVCRNITRHEGSNTPIEIPFWIPPSASLLRENTSSISYLMRQLSFPLEKFGGGGTTFDINHEMLRELSDAFQTSSGTLSQDVFASAPVRTQPLRTYTPSELLASSEGSHVPLELSRARAKDPERWSAIREGLISFGEKSGLFTDLDIRQLGKGDIDPFQIMVRVNGPAMNLTDVGYGVSQVLPIVYQVQHSSRHGTYLLQQPEIHLHPRAQAELGSLLATMTAGKGSRPTFVVETHSDYLVDRVRIEVAAKRISHNDVTIVFFQRGQHGSTARNLFLNDRGDIKDAPDEFRAFFIEEHGKLLGL